MAIVLAGKGEWGRLDARQGWTVGSVTTFTV
jgi:hypothetical protein